MLKVFKFGAALVATAAIHSVAWAEFTNEELPAASAVAVRDFSVANPSHAPHMSGFKTWKSGDDAKVKIYAAHDGMNMEFNFQCHKHGTNIECHAQ